MNQLNKRNNASKTIEGEKKIDLSTGEKRAIFSNLIKKIKLQKTVMNRKLLVASQVAEKV